MKKIENVFAAGDIGLLKAQIGLVLESMTHDEFQQNSISYGQVGLRIGGKDYVLSNWHKGFDDYFGAEDDVPCLSFAEGMAKHEEGSVPLVETAVKSKITAISIIRETVAVRPEDEDGTGLTTDEGVIIETEPANTPCSWSTQISWSSSKFCKGKTCFRKSLSQKRDGICPTQSPSFEGKQ